MKHPLLQHISIIPFLRISLDVALVILMMALVPLDAFTQHGGGQFSGAHFGGARPFSRGGGMVGHPGSSSRLSSPHLTYDPRSAASSSFFAGSGFAPHLRSSRLVRRRSQLPLGRSGGFKRGTLGSAFYGWGWLGPDCEPYWAWDWECGPRPDGWSNYSDAEFGEVEPRPMVVFYLRDGTGFGATDYWRVDDTLHLKTTYDADKTFAMDQVDMQRTVDDNAARVFILRWVMYRRS